MFTEMIYGDTLWHKHQALVNRETVQRDIRSGKSVLMLDVEAGVSYMTEGDDHEDKL